LRSPGRISPVQQSRSRPIRSACPSTSARPFTYAAHRTSALSSLFRFISAARRRAAATLAIGDDIPLNESVIGDEARNVQLDEPLLDDLRGRQNPNFDRLSRLGSCRLRGAHNPGQGVPKRVLAQAHPQGLTWRRASRAWAHFLLENEFYRVTPLKFKDHLPVHGLSSQVRNPNENLNNLGFPVQKSQTKSQTDRKRS